MATRRRTPPPLVPLPQGGAGGVVPVASKLGTSAPVSSTAADNLQDTELTPQPQTPVGTEDGVDICSSMFDVCRHCQEDHLDRHGAVCMFDVDGGQMPVWMFQVLKAIVEMVVADIAAGAHRRAGGSAVGITVKHAGGFWALAIAENLSGPAGEGRSARRLTMVRALTDRLECVVRILPNPSGSTIAIAFPAGGVEPEIIPPRILH